ncbi:MAG: ABC transporter ATP-binding protein [bacterium]
MICAEHLVQRFGRVSALADVSFLIGRGEMIGLIGPSGAGKTTLLRVLSTCMTPTSGVITLDGINTREESLRVRRLLGYMPEKDPLYPRMRVMEYLTFRAQLRGLSGRTRTKRLRELVGRCGLAGLEKALMGNLSKGEVRRVLLADCLVGEPAVVLLDEPTLGLDPLNGERVRAVFSQMKGERTVMFSTHDMAEAESLCSRVMILDRGRLAAFAAPGDLLKQFGVAGLGEVIKAVAAGDGA